MRSRTVRCRCDSCVDSKWLVVLSASIDRFCPISWPRELGAAGRLVHFAAVDP